MDTKILYYKKFEGSVKPDDYKGWAFSMLHNEVSSPSLNILTSLPEPLNIFEVEDYFTRALKELEIEEPSYEESAESYIHFLLEKVVVDQGNAVKYAFEVYEVVRDHFIGDGLDIWYEISEVIDDFLYGDNNKNITQDSLNNMIVQEAKKQLEISFPIY